MKFSARYYVFGLILSTFSVYAQKTDGQYCEFDDDYIIINSTTISKFPTGDEDYCYRIDSSIRIDETTDVTHEQLYNAFGRLETMYGTLEVVNTAFTNLSFFSTLFGLFNYFDGGFGYDLIILNNSKLETMAGGALLTINAQIRIEDNPLLDPNCDHVLERYSRGRRIRGNRLNCGCELDFPLTTANINGVEDNCTAIFGALYLFGPDAPPAEILMRKFGNANQVYGEVAVISTDYEDLNFLRNVELVECYYSRSGTNNLERFVRIENNAKLKRLSWPKVKVEGSPTIQVAGNPKLCLTIAELDGLLSSWYAYKVGTKVCEEVEPMESTEKVCRIGDAASLATIPANCRTLVGHLTIDHGSSERDLWKLYNVTKIYGKLVIRNSSLKGFAPLWKLKEMYNLAEYESAFVVESNPRLKSAYLKELMRILSDFEIAWEMCLTSSDRPVHIENNPVLMMSSDECLSLETSARIDFQKNRKDCIALRTKSANVDANCDCLLLFSSLCVSLYLACCL